MNRFEEVGLAEDVVEERGWIRGLRMKRFGGVGLAAEQSEVPPVHMPKATA